MESRAPGLSQMLAAVLVLNLVILVSLGLDYIHASGLTRLQWFAFGSAGAAILVGVRTLQTSNKLGLRRRALARLLSYE